MLMPLAAAIDVGITAGYVQWPDVDAVYTAEKEQAIFSYYCSIIMTCDSASIQ